MTSTRSVGTSNLSFPAAIPTRMVPKEGDKINFEGTPTSYTPKPFVMVMEKGALLTKAAPPAARSRRCTRSRNKEIRSQTQK